VLAVAITALAVLGPPAVRTFAATVPAHLADSLLPQRAVGTAGSVRAAVLLDSWFDTVSITDPTKNISAMNEAEFESLAAALATLSPTGQPFAAAQIELSLVGGSAGQFESNYKQISQQTTVFQSAKLVSAFLNGEASAFSRMASLPTTNSFAQALLTQKVTLLNQEITAFESWYFNATKNHTAPDTILAQLNTFTESFLAASKTFTDIQVQELQSGQISQTAFTFTPPVF